VVEISAAIFFLTAVYTPVYTLGMAKQQYNMRFEPDLMAWVDAQAKTEGLNRTTFVERLLESAREGRVVIRPRGPDAFPRESTPAGSTLDYPILVAGLE
jgi:hypothetical protein